MSYAIITLVGNLGQDPDIKYLADGTAVASFSVAHSRRRKDQESTTWWRCSMFGKRAETIGQYFHKGSRILVTGEPFAREYTNKNGETKTSMEISVSDFSFVDSKADQDSPQRSKSYSAPAADAPFDDDIPF